MMTMESYFQGSLQGQGQHITENQVNKRTFAISVRACAQDVSKSGKVTQERKIFKQSN